jgi:hypothetical protein
LFVAALLCGLPPQAAHATVITDASLTISGITIAPAAGTLLIDPWTAEASASANNSLGQNVGQFDSSDTVALANAIITFANASATSSATGLSITATSAVNLPGILNQAASTGLADLFTFFAITGGSGDVDVTFGMNVLPSQHAFVDALGIVRSELVASLDLDGDTVLFRDDLLQHASSPGGVVDPIRLTGTRTLTFDTFYFVFVQADSESSGINLPEPTAAILVVTALGLLRCCTCRKGAATKHKKQ